MEDLKIIQMTPEEQEQFRTELELGPGETWFLSEAEKENMTAHLEQDPRSQSYDITRDVVRRQEQLRQDQRDLLEIALVLIGGLTTARVDFQKEDLFDVAERLLAEFRKRCAKMECRCAPQPEGSRLEEGEE